jgi:peptidoglycan/LPS O-acetylase OafA/YrhL
MKDFKWTNYIHLKIKYLICLKKTPATFNIQRFTFQLSPEIMEKIRFAYVDGLRGVAASIVVLFHAVEGEHIRTLFNTFPAWIQVMLRHGDLGVAIFFVLSGFVIAHSLRAELTPAGALRFALKRSIRLDPPYWVGIAIAILFALLASLVVAGRPANTFSTPQIVSHVFYLQGILGYKNINPVFWTLCLEIQLYLAYALLRLTRCTPILCAAFVASLIWPLGLHDGWPGVFVGFWFAFLLGAGAYLAWTNLSARPWFLGYASIIVVAALYRSDYFALTCCITGISLLIVSVANLQTCLMNWRWLQYLGMISYSLYLIHNPVTGAVFRVGFMLTERSIYSEAGWWLVSLAACVAGAALLWRFVERPSMILAKRFDARLANGRKQISCAKHIEKAV